MTYLTGISGSNQWSLFSVSYSRSAIIGTPKIEKEKKKDNDNDNDKGHDKDNDKTLKRQRQRQRQYMS